MMTATHGPRVLVVGGHVMDNNFVRNVKSAGCVVYWHDGKPGKSFPHFCDALICAKFQLSHEGFWSAKEAYKGKPLFVADHSWSTIKERFDTYVTEWRSKHQPKKTIIREAMEKAMTYPKKEIKESLRNAIKAKMEFPYTPELKQKIFSQMAKCSDLGPTAAAQYLKDAGVVKSNGKPFVAMDVNNWRGLQGYKKFLEGLKTSTKAQHVPVHRPEKITAKVPRQTDKLVYELILSANLGAVETTALMRRCMDGRLSQDEALKFIELYSDLKDGGVK